VTVGGMLIRGGSRALRQPPLASVPEANQERCTLVDMQFLPVLPYFGFASASHDFVGTAGGDQRHLARMSPHSFTYTGTTAIRLRRFVVWAIGRGSRCAGSSRMSLHGFP
jgi:hypothetical protein